MSDKKTAQELGRYQKKCERLMQEVRDLKAQSAGYQEAVDLSYAMISAVVEKTGTVAVSQEDINGVLQAQRFAECLYDPERKTYTLRAGKAE